MLSTTHSLIRDLKQGTADAHRSLEGALNLLRPDYDLASYTRLLEKFYGFYAPWEAACGPHIQARIPGFWAPRAKLPLLEADLRALGASAAAAPLCPRLPRLESFSEAVGSMYVLEGSTLGGRILSRHFQDTLGVTPEAGGAYFHAYGERCGDMWRTFCVTVDGFLESIDSGTAITAARETFAALQMWLPESA